MITCRNCAGTYDEANEICPHCGYKPRVVAALAPKGTAIRRQQAIAKARGLATPPPETREVPAATVTPPPVAQAKPAPVERTKTDPGLVPVPAGEDAPPSPFEPLANDLRKELDTRGRMISWVNGNVPVERNKELLQAASHGDMHAMLLLGFSLFARSTDRTTLRDAMVWLQQAANYGSGHASTALGVVYQGVTGMPPNAAVARQHYEKAVTAGVPMAANNLGKMYEEGAGVTQDAAKARELFALAASKGLSLGMNNLGRYLLGGLGGPKDAAKGVEMLSR
ncbi:partial Secretory immunoglobulin A-binding protein EsiB, partial [uncultured bacterium]